MRPGLRTLPISKSERSEHRSRVIGTRFLIATAIPLILGCQFALAKKEIKRANSTAQLGVKTPGVQIPMADLKAEAEIALEAEVATVVVVAESVYAAIKQKDQLAPIDAKTNKTAEPIAGLQQPCATLVEAFNSVWIPNCGASTVSRLDTKEKKVTASIPLGIVEGPQTMAASGDSVWAISDSKTTLTRIDPEEKKIVAETRLAAGCNAMLFAESSLWVTCPNDDKVLRIDPRTNLVAKSIEVAGQPAALAFGEGTVWVLTRAEGKVMRLDPKTDKISATVELKAPAPTGAIVVSDGFAWVSIPGFPISRIDPATDKVAQQFVGDGGGAIYAGKDSIWLPNLKPNTLSRFDTKRIRATLAD